MGIASLTLYRNPYDYPKFTETLTQVGYTEQITPINIGLRTGKMRIEATMGEMMGCNYLKIDRDGGSFYAWIDNVEYLNDVIFNVSYTIDPWRTYKDKIDLGYQYIQRDIYPTLKKDELLSTTLPYVDINTYTHNMPTAGKRVLVVQARHTDSGSLFSNVPVQPSPYDLYFQEYDVNDWTANTNIYTLFNAIMSNNKPKNVVTVYSIPYVNFDYLGVSNPLKLDTDPEMVIEGFYQFNNQNSDNPDITGATTTRGELDLSFVDDDFFKTEHQVQLVVPEAGVIELSDELLSQSKLYLRQDVDVFSGASNYMLENGTGDLFDKSIRGSSISHIPIVGDPEETYISNNQNALTTSLIGDVANIGMGAATMFASGGIGAGIGGAQVMSGISGILNRRATIKDIGDNFVNPTAFLGTATAGALNGQFWLVVRQARSDNKQIVNDNFGYPVDMIKNLAFPTQGYVKTEGCVVSADGTVPRWAMQEINQMFDNGVYVI